nr:NACHT domain-containing protein [Nostoc sp. ChiQUE02]MDZ8228818.1 NACHT domain-containing protein [Nostoc sp. ChiQUE02]
MEEPNPPDNRNINTEGGNYNERIEGDYIQGNVFQNIFNILGGQQITPIGNPARPKNERLLLAAVKEEVTARLRQSLHNAVLINLSKESQPQQVKRPWDTEIKIGLKPAEPLPDTTTILEVFDSQEIAGKLLILGAPGSGKTTTQLELAHELIKQAEEQPDYPVPVLFNLSSWKDDRQSITDWLVAELKSKYGVSTKLGKDWVDNQQLLPLLDGLDELDPQRQESCVQAINQFLASENRPFSLVVCSRSEEYSNYSTQLQLNGAIYLQSLTNNQICDYLTSINYIELWSTISNDLDLLELVKTPLLLSITVLASQEISVEQWQHLNSTADRIQYLLDAYVGRMLTRDINSRAYFQNKIPIARKTRMWLVWLAKRMQTEAQIEFLIEQLQPSLLKTKISKIIYNLVVWVVIQTLIFGLIFGLIGGLIFGLIIGPSYGLILGLLGLIRGLFFGMLFGMFTGLCFGLSNAFFGDIIDYQLEQINLIKFNKTFNKTIIKWLILGLILGLISVLIIDDPSPRSRLISGLILGLILGLISGTIGDKIQAVETLNFSYHKFKKGLIIGLSYGLIIGMISGLITGLSYGLISGLILGLILGFHGLEIENKTIPNQGILQSAKNTAKLSALFFLISIILIFLIQLSIINNNSLYEAFKVITNEALKVFSKEDLKKFSNEAYKAYKALTLNEALIFSLMSLISGLFLGLLIGIPRSGTPVIKHFTLRLILYFNGYIPWNYARFLNYCTERLFLQRVGGRYRFIHKLLQDHFAKMEFKRD